jgi:hypothetical protein
MMENLLIQHSNKTPQVEGNANAGLITFKGKLIPEDVFNFFNPINSWIKDYCTEPAPVTRVEFEIPYMNTLSTTKVLGMLKLLNTVVENKTSVVTVVWKFEAFDTDTYDCGLNFQKLTGLHFEFVNV